MHKGIMALEGLEQAEEANVTVVDEGQAALDFGDATLGGAEVTQQINTEMDNIAEAEDVHDTLVKISDKMEQGGDVSPAAAEAINVAVEHMLVRIGVPAGSKHIPAFESEDAEKPGAIQKFKAMIAKIWAALKAAVLRVVEWFMKAWEHLFGREAAIERKTEAVIQKQHALVAKHGSEVLHAAEAKIAEEQKDLGMFSEEVMVEEIPNLEELLTKTLEAAEKSSKVVAESNDDFYGFPAIRNMKLAKYFQSPRSYAPTMWSYVFYGTERLMKMEDALAHAAGDLTNEAVRASTYTSGLSNNDAFDSKKFLDRAIKTFKEVGKVGALDAGWLTVHDHAHPDATTAVIPLAFERYGMVFPNYEAGTLTLQTGTYNQMNSQNYENHNGVLQICPINKIDFLKTMIHNGPASMKKNLADLEGFCKSIMDDAPTQKEMSDDEGKAYMHSYVVVTRYLRSLCTTTMHLATLMAHQRQKHNVMLLEWIEQSQVLLDHYATQAKREKEMQAA
jgi:hypothetical protein